MIAIKKKVKRSLRISFGKDVQTEHFPISVAEGLDVVMKTNDYKRLPKTKNNHEEFIWENNKGERLAVKYYTQVNTITFSIMLGDDLSQNKEDIVKRLNTLYNKLDSTIGNISQYLGSPYISSTRELRVEIEGTNPAQKAKLLVPIIQELYRKTEGIQLFNVDTLEQTNSSIQILFGFLE